MKPIPAIVERAIDADLDAIRQHLHVELAGERDDIRAAERHESEAKRHAAAGAAARESARQRRLRIGGWLAKARVAWPTRGPNAKGWGLFLKEFGIGEDSALRYMAEAKQAQEAPDGFPQDRTSAGKLEPADPADDTCGGQYGIKVTPAPDPDRATAAPFHQLTAAEIVQALARLPPEERKRVLGKANVHGASGERKRGAYCTPKKYADAVGPWDLDPFTNPRSHIVAAARCMLEDGGDGFGDRATPGAYRVGASREIKIATADTRVWIQPDYRFVLEAIEHYGHTRFCALLRFAPDTEWFALLWPLVRVVAIPVGERIAFEGEGESEEDAEGAPFPHAFFFADERDLTNELRSMCLVWRVEHQPTNPTEIA